MKLTENITINGNPIVLPEADASISSNDLDAEGSGRDETGYMHRIVLRKGVKKMSFRIPVLSEEEYNYMENLLSASEEFDFSINIGNYFRTFRAYCSTTSAILHNAKEGIYKNYSFDIIEC